MKKRNLTTLTVVALLLVLLTLIAVSGTYAKYTTTITGSSTAVIAKWNFSATDEQGTKLEEDFVINLADTATVGKVTVGEGDSAVNKIQPGSKGAIVITIDNTDSDVAASLTIEATAIDGSPLTADQFTFKDPVIKNADGTEISSVPAGETATATVEWEWIYDSGNDEADTTVGSNEAAQNGTAVDFIGLTVTGYQAAPTT